MSSQNQNLGQDQGGSEGEGSNLNGNNGGTDGQGTGSAAQNDGKGGSEGGSGTNTPEDKTGAGEGTPDTFPRTYVEQLRTESAAHRTRAAGMAEELHALRVASLGLLQDPTDLPPADGLDTLDAVKAAVEDLVTRKPHLKVRKVGGNIGQHEQQGSEQGPGLLGRMRKNA